VNDHGRLAIVGPFAEDANSISGVVADDNSAWRISFHRRDPASDADQHVTEAIEKGGLATVQAGRPKAPQEDRPSAQASQADPQSSLPSHQRIWIAVAAAALLSAAAYLVRRCHD
jgi:hypothetical protein